MNRWVANLKKKMFPQTLAVAQAALPFKIAYDDLAANLVTENINWLIKSVAQTINYKEKLQGQNVLKIYPAF